MEETGTQGVQCDEVTNGGRGEEGREGMGGHMIHALLELLIGRAEEGVAPSCVCGDN